ncbi:peptidase [Enterococcus faecalis]|nr:peptidase [Enterococcus gallinarum]ROW95265.1 peptidase [Enterococcus faecalis]ROX24715.1 peptidase [Enterococcus faecalis]
MIVDKINKLLKYQCFEALFPKKHLSHHTKKFLWVILRLFTSERYLLCSNQFLSK